MSLSIRKSVVIAAVVLLVAGVWARAQVVKEVPSNTLVLIKLNNLAGTSAKLGNIFKQLGLVEVNADLADPLALMTRESKMGQGVNTGGDLMVALADAGPDKRDNSFIFLIPVADYKAFLGNFGEARVVDGVDVVALPDGSGKQMYVAHWAPYAALSEKKALVSKQPDGMPLAAMAAKDINAHDLFVYLNMNAMRTKFMGDLKTNRAKWLKEAEQGISAQSRMNDDSPEEETATQPATGPGAKAEKYRALIQVVLNQVFDAGEALLRDTQAVTLSVDLNDSGIRTICQVDFDPASYIGQTVASLKNSEGSMLKGLPAAKYLVFGGMVEEPAVVAKIFDDLLNPAVAELTKLGDDAKPIVAFIQAIRTGMAARTSTNFGMVAPGGMLGAESLFQAITISEGDAAAIHEAQKAQLTAQQECMKLVNNQSANATITITPQAKTMDGVTLDQFQVQFVGNPQNPQEMQAAQMMKMMWGPKGFGGYAGVVDAQHHIAVAGVNDVLLGQAIAAVKAGNDTLGEEPGVKAVAANLPAKRIAVTYIALDTVASTALGYARQFGLPVQVQIPPDLPPVGMTLASQGSLIRVDAYVPMQLIQGMVSAGIQAWQASQMPPGEPGEPPPGPEL